MEPAQPQAFIGRLKEEVNRVESIELVGKPQTLIIEPEAIVDGDGLIARSILEKLDCLKTTEPSFPKTDSIAG